MPPAVKNEFAKNPVATISALIASALAIVSLGVVMAVVPAWAEEVNQRLRFNERADEKHHDDAELHMPYHEKVERFVTRDEWMAHGIATQRQLDEIKESMKRQEDKLDKVIERLSR